jgi:hypothetical protein
LLAAAARFGADPAVLVHGGVTLTFVAAGPAHRGTRLQDASRDIRVIAGVPRNDARRDTANISAIFAGPDALT